MGEWIWSCAHFYNRTDSTKSPVSGAGDFSEPRLMSLAMELSVFVCPRNSCSNATEIGGP